MITSTGLNSAVGTWQSIRQSWAAEAGEQCAQIMWVSATVSLS